MNSETAKLKILLIEDSATDAALLEAQLKEVVELEFETHHAKELAQGLKNIDQEKYDAVILDLGLPDSYGVPTYERVREQSPQLPIIIVSGNDDRELMNEALHRGADNYLLKESFDGNRIAVAILSAIRRKSPRN